SVGPNGMQSNGHSSFVALSADGSLVAYQSLATNLVPDDTNELVDVFASAKFDFAPTPEPTVGPTTTATPLPAADLGDVDCSGSVTSIDAALVLQFTANLLGALPCQDAADANANGEINSIDATLILQFTAGFFQTLPP
ncbi:MAG: dockerin type I repeat-containing protein, partial [Chloroflexi bacterium]|nr:dockerin type I repeat-containing protein [Chloroflexota bacterium]